MKKMSLRAVLVAGALVCCLVPAWLTAEPAELPVFLADNHAETFGWITRTFDLDQPHTLVLVDAHSDASAAERSEALREQLRRVPSATERATRVEQWRRTGRLQAFNWLEPLMPRPLDQVRWIAGVSLTEETRARLAAEAGASLDGRLEVEPRSSGSLASRWEVTDWTTLTRWSPGPRRVVLAIDLDFFAGMADAAERFDQLWRAAMAWPGLDGVALAVSRPWLTDDAEADRLVLLALDTARRTRGARIECDLALDDRPDASLKAGGYRSSGTSPPRWDITLAAPPLRALLERQAGEWRHHDRARPCDATLWGRWPTATWAADGLESDCDGVWRFPAGAPPMLRLTPADATAATGRVRWFARRPVDTACDLLPETGLGKGFSHNPARWIYEARSSLGETTDFALAPAAWANLLDPRYHCGRVVVEAEWETPSGWLPAGEIDLRGVVAGDRFRGGLSECFGMPYVFGIALASDTTGHRGVDTGWGADCSNFLVHAWRRAGTRLGWGDPARVKRQLATRARNLTGACRLPIDPASAARGVVIDFGAHMAAWWEDREPLGVLDGGDLMVHHLGGMPEVLPLAELASNRPPFAVLTPRDGPACRLALLGDVVLAGAATPDLTPLQSAATADLTIANLEGIPAATEGPAAVRFDFRFPAEQLAALCAAGVDVVSLANNHAADAGVGAIPAGRAAIQLAGIGVVGAGANVHEALTPWRDTAHGLLLSVFGVCAVDAPAASADTPGVVALPCHADLLAHAIATERAAGRVVVVMVHWGDEYVVRVNDDQRRWARWLADCGATVIAGSGPHVVQKTDHHAGAVIANSLGNAIYPPALAAAGSGALWQVTISTAGAVREQAIRLPPNPRPDFQQ